MDSQDKKDLDALYALLQAQQLVLAVLIRHAPSFAAVQIELAVALERAVAPGGQLGSASDHAKAAARELVDWLGAVKPAGHSGLPGSDPNR